MWNGFLRGFFCARPDRHHDRRRHRSRRGINEKSSLYDDHRGSGCQSHCRHRQNAGAGQLYDFLKAKKCSIKHGRLCISLHRRLFAPARWMIMEEYLIYFGGAPAELAHGKEGALYAFFRLLRRAAGTDLLFGAGRGAGRNAVGRAGVAGRLFCAPADAGQSCMEWDRHGAAGQPVRAQCSGKRGCSAGGSGGRGMDSSSASGIFFRTFSPQLSGVPDCYWKPEGSGRARRCPLTTGVRFCCRVISVFARIERLWERLMPFLSLTRLDNRSCRKRRKGRYTVHSHRIPPFEHGRAFNACPHPEVCSARA